MKELDLITPSWGRPQLETETRRIFDVCDGCRRCFNLCPSFNTLLDRIDATDSHVEQMTAQDFEQVEKECYYCKLCFNHCPYTPPHQYHIDFPRLMVAWKKQRAIEQGSHWRDKLLIRTDLIGNVGSRTAWLTNRLMRIPWIRIALERVAGIHRKRWVLPFQEETFMDWWGRRMPRGPRPTSKRKIVLFPSCLVNYQATDIGKATVQVLEKNSIEVVVPTQQQCCGMPAFDIGDTNRIVQAAKANLATLKPWLEVGFDVVAPIPSCSLMLKREYGNLCPGDETGQLAERTFDICEYLIRLKRENALSLDFARPPGRVAYHVPCHLRDQNVGFKSKELMEVSGAKVRVIERCSGHDGSWGAKTEFFDLSMTIAKKAIKEVEDGPADLVASDCPLAALQLDQAFSGERQGSQRTLHPIQIIRDAYQLPS